MSPQKKKRKTAKTKKPPLKPSPMLPPSSESTPIPSLPDDLLVSCFARVSKLYYPTLSLVSKSFRSLLTSPELHKTRSLLGRTEICLFVCLERYPDSTHRWFTLCRKPNQTLTNAISNNKKKKKKSSGYVLAPIPIPNSPQALWEERVVAVGSNIYMIGGPIDKAYTPSSSVSILDCRTYTWHKAPNMRVERLYSKVNVCDGKIYVTGGCKDYDFSNWMEVFDPKTQTWELVLLSTLAAERCGDQIQNIAMNDRETVMCGYNTGVVYKPKEDKWEAIEDYDMKLGLLQVSSCVVDNVLYSYYLGLKIKWYDSKRRCWMDVKGLESMPKFAHYAFKRLVNYDGKMVVLWDKYLPSSGYKKSVIWCAVIALERRNNNQEIWGNVEWLDGVLTVPESYHFLGVVTATV